MPIFCIHCGAQLNESSKFCEGCGKAAKTQTTSKQDNTCQSCGYPLNPGVKFCKGCGAKTGEQATITTPPPVQPSPPQPLQPPPPRPVYTPPQPTHAQSSTKPSNKGGKTPFVAIVSVVLAIALIVTGIFTIPNMFGGGDDTMARGKSASVKNGVIELEGATLDFGANTVNNGAKLTVLKPTARQKPDGLLSGLFELAIETKCTEPVVLSLPVDESLIPDGCIVMLSVGNTLETDNGYGDTIYSHYPADVRNGMATATFIPADSLQDLDVRGAGGPGIFVTSSEKLQVGVYWYYTGSVELETGGHFIVYFKGHQVLSLTETNRKDMLSDLEAVYSYYTSKGYTYSKRSTGWPFSIYVEEISAKAYYVFREDGHIQLNRDLFSKGYSNRNEVMSLMTHEFFHFVQYNYYQSRFSDNLWFDEATATYFEVLKGGSPSLINEYFELNFSGVFPKDDRKATKHDGYARGPLIGYLVGRYGEDFILKAYQAAAATNYPFFSMIIPTVTQDTFHWVADYYEALVTGQIDTYSIFPAAMRLNIENNPDYKNTIGYTLQLVIPNEKDIADAKAKGEMPLMGKTSVRLGDYNAQFVVLNIDLKATDSVSDPIISVEGRDAELVDIRVIAYRGRDITVLRDVDGKITLNDYARNVRDGVAYIVMATGLAGAKEAYDVKVEMMPSQWQLDPQEGYTGADYGMEYSFTLTGSEIHENVERVEITYDYGDGGEKAYDVIYADVVSGEVTIDIPSYTYELAKVSDKKTEYTLSVIVRKIEKGYLAPAPIAILSAPIKMNEYSVRIDAPRLAVYEMQPDVTEDNAGAEHEFDVFVRSTSSANLTWEWDFGDGETLDGPISDNKHSISHMYWGVDTYSPKVTLYVNDQPVAEDSITVRIELASNTPTTTKLPTEEPNQPSGYSGTYKGIVYYSYRAVALGEATYEEGEGIAIYDANAHTLHIEGFGGLNKTFNTMGYESYNEWNEYFEIDIRTDEEWLSCMIGEWRIENGKRFMMLNFHYSIIPPDYGGGYSHGWSNGNDTTAWEKQ